MKYMRLTHHFEPQAGWINDPNGLIYFRGQYHAFFQHNPHAAQWGPMHWGHAVSRDLLHWEELPIALTPDQAYENDGCYSGSAIEKDGKLYLFYTSVSRELGQTQSVAVSVDGVRFEKYSQNPVIAKNPLGHADFRDPKVTQINGIYHMVVGSGNATSGQVLLFQSDDLLHWDFRGVLFESAACCGCIECPDFFPLGDKYVLLFSKLDAKWKAAQFVVGDFVDGKLVNYTIQRPERGIDFYAPQTFLHEGRRIMIGWMYHWGKRPPKDCAYAGALSIPRELTLHDGKINTYPVKEAQHLLKKFTSFDVLTDTKTAEIFYRGGKASWTFWWRR